jgi:hypothetical protein
MIYANYGYLIIDDDIMIDIADYWNIEDNRLKVYLDLIAQVGLINEQLYKTARCATSLDIQQRIATIARSTHKKVTIPAKFTIRDEESGLSSDSLNTDEKFKKREENTKECGIEHGFFAKNAEPAPESSRKTSSQPHDFRNISQHNISKDNISSSSYSPSKEEEEERTKLHEAKENLRKLVDEVIMYCGASAEEAHLLRRMIPGEETRTILTSLFEEVKADKTFQKTFGRYLFPMICQAIRDGRIQVEEDPRPMQALKADMAAVGVKSYEIESNINAIKAHQKEVREAVEAVRKSRGKITMPGRYIMSVINSLPS